MKEGNKKYQQKKPLRFFGKIIDDSIKGFNKYIEQAPIREQKKIEQLDRKIKIQSKKLQLEKLRSQERDLKTERKKKLEMHFGMDTHNKPTGIILGYDPKNERRRI